MLMEFVTATIDEMETIVNKMRDLRNMKENSDAKISPVEFIEPPEFPGNVKKIMEELENVRRKIWDAFNPANCKK